MRDVGKHFTVNAMLAKESVKRRTESDEGISYTEFSYSLQAMTSSSCTSLCTARCRWAAAINGATSLRAWT